MLQRFERRMEAVLEALARSAQTGRLCEMALAQQRLGRLQEKNWRVVSLYDVRIEPRGDGRLAVEWSRCSDEQAWRRRSTGCYVLRTNLENPDAVELWKHYMQLSDAEWAFRITKDELEIRPI